jgi:deazaflavin-dependent oxidoreductase (nitroreductase family)
VSPRRASLRPGRLAKRVLAVPALLYKIGAGRLLGHRFLLLTHSGRKSGRLYRAFLEVVRWDPAKEEAVVMSGLGNRAAWYLNALAGGAQEVQIGDRRFQPVVRPLEPQEAERVFAEYERHSRLVALALRPLLSRLAGFRYDGSRAARMRLVETLPMMALVAATESRPDRERAADQGPPVAGPSAQRKKACPRSARRANARGGS